LDRKSLFSRRSAGTKVSKQFIASNVETVFIVSSLNDDFNLSRIERYLVTAREACVDPIIVLTKADLANNQESLLSQLSEFDANLRVICVNALDMATCIELKNECAIGKTVALLGSSGVGKSTLVNTLLMSNQQKTKGIREDDSKGRHTTTARSIHFIPSGGIIIDTPGMRELQLASCEEDIESTFDDISKLALACRFSDCSHEIEKGCAVLDAIDRGMISRRRLNNYLKLKREALRNSMALHERKAKEKSFSKMVNSVIRQNQR
jgi:ribosome biogenesis GTPase